MIDIKFSALGTHWNISIDDPNISRHTELVSVSSEIKEKTASFEHRFSRFIDTSEVNQFRHAKSGTYTISPELYKLLSWCEELKQLTNGRFDPAIATLLETLGYDQNYTLVSKDTTNWHAVFWKLENKKLYIDCPIVFDLGGVGKGYWIDELSSYLKSQNIQYFLVEGGGDMYGTSKSDGSPWNIALEYPNKPGYSLGTLQLKNSAFAGSDIYKRSWSNLHHLLDASTHAPLNSCVACFTTAHTALVADSMTKVLMLTNPLVHQKISQKYQLNYLLMKPDQSLNQSPCWPGEIFS